MKNLSSIPCLSLFEAFTILITLAVCLAGFTEAEVRSNLRKHAYDSYGSKEASIRENVPYSYKTANLRGGELQQTNLENVNNLHGGSLEKLIKRQSDDFGESADSESERENDGYGYDDDEYYHFNYKRNDDVVGNAEMNKKNKESIGETNRKEGIVTSQKLSNGKAQKETDKETQTIEMLNFKEFHPKIGGNENPNQNTAQEPKPLTFETAHRKFPSSPLDSLNMRDLKGNSAIDEKLKDRKDESGGVLAASSSDNKVAESKKGIKTPEDKDPVKLKDSKVVEEPEKKEKEASLKDVKENVVTKNLKENAKGSEEKDKNLKLSDNAKLEENLEKLNAKNKESETAKIAKEDKDSSKLIEKARVDVINPNDISQISNRASFVSSDYKDSLEAIKPTASEDDEKNSEEINDSEKNVGLSDYEDLRERQEKMRQMSVQESDQPNEQDMTGQARQAAIKANEYLSFPVTFEMKDGDENDYFKKRESWNDRSKFHLQSEQVQQQIQDQEQQQQQQQQQQPDQMAFEHGVKNSYHLKFPPSELENTDYHKNFIKSLRRYKGLGEAKVLTPESTSFSSVEKGSQGSREARKKKRSKVKKRRSMMSGDKDTAESGHSKSRRNAFRNEERSQWYPTLQRQDSQALSLAKTGESDSKLFENKKYDAQQENSRQRRKSPSKLEYEIKIINQNQQEAKNAPLSNLRMKKDVKMKLATDDKYLKKYPYSQVSREDLTILGEPDPDKKYKRKAPVWMRNDQSKGSVIQTRGLPSGYYGNRVKFGQKNYARTDDKSNGEQPSADVSKLSYSQTPSEKSSFQRTWELKPPDYKHDPMKRYDETGVGGSRVSNSLLLIKKGQNGERIAKTFEQTKDQEDKGDSERLVKLLSKDNDYVILKKTDTNKYRKVSEPDPGLISQPEGPGRKSSMEGESQGKQSAKNKGVYTRSSHKEEKKYSSLHGAAGKSNLKKTFEKFRDLADFFKDSDQESTDNQYSTQEVKEGRDIVFSEDKLPDPIVISNDGNPKSESLNQKPMNSIYSISTNFKRLDQQERKDDVPKENDSSKNMLTAEVKSDTQEFSWEPALKNAFPEAKTINTMSKNGNEIIVLDFNRNQLKNEHGYFTPVKANSKTPSTGGGGPWVPGGRLLNSLGQRQVEVVLPTDLSLFEKSSREDEKSAPIMFRQNGPYAVFDASDGQQVSIPLNQLAQLPSLFKTLAEKKTTALGTNLKSLMKKSTKWTTSQNAMSDNYNQFLKDLHELSELNKKGKLAEKRNTKEIKLPASSFSELSSYSDVNIRKLGNLLQNILSNQNGGSDGSEQGVLENGKPGYLKGWYPAGYDARRQWMSPDSKGNEQPSLVGGKAEVLPAEGKEGMEKNYLWEELAGTSGKMQRLRREGTGKRKLRKTMEDALSLRDGRETKKEGQCPAEMEEKCLIKLGSDTLDSKDETAVASQSTRETDNSKLSEEDESKESAERGRSLKSDYEGHLNELFENLSSDKNQKDQLNIPNESASNRGKRKDNGRRKRSSRRDVKNKVSTTEVQNKLLNLPEDNYPSVYSPGIKRRLLSTGNEAEDADGYYGADEHDRSEVTEGGEANCAKNSRNKCVDPMILELFGEQNAAGEKNRGRRSLTSGFHSNFKREIDLDESMPNDFQNFLVTSLGGFGSQKREVVKKEEALWEGKESGQENYNQIVESSPGGKDASEDSALEKREVSSAEKHKNQKYKAPSYFGPGTQSLGATAHSQKITRSEDKSAVGTKTSEYEEKVPTQIRIQITNAGEKEKKSAKSGAEESETSSADIESLSKKEFFDKNKMNHLGVSTLPKLHQFSKPSFSLMDYDDCDNGDASKQKPFGLRQFRRRRRKKKKFVPENPMKPIKDFIAFDQKAMEILLRKYMADQNLAGQQHTTQKVPMSNHLPQVETVYNPTQGTNKAQLDASRITKMNSISNKNADNAKNTLQSNDASAYDESILRSYLKDKSNKAKSDKAFGKDFEDIDWKPFSGKLRMRTDPGRDSQVGVSLQNMKSFGGDVVSSLNHASNTPSSRIFNPYSQNPYYQKWLQSPYNNYFYHPPNMNVVNSNSFYDALKLKQELKNHGLGKGIMMKEHSPAKPPQKPFYYNDGNIYTNKVDDKDRTPNFLTTAEPTWSNYDYNFNKKPFAPKLKSHDFFNSGIKPQVDSRAKSPYPSTGSKFMKSIDDEKLFDTTQSRPMDSKDADYLDVLEDDYADDDANKDLQFDEPIITDVIKKSSKVYDPSAFRHMFSYKPSDADGDGIVDSDDEFEDEYDEATDEDDLDDYSLLANSREVDPGLTKNSRATVNLQGTYRPEDSFSRLSTFYPRSSQFEIKGNSFEQTEYNNPKSDEKFQQGRQTMPLVDLKSDIDPLSGSSNILKKANENSNIFGKNLMKNLNKYSYDESWRYPEKLQEDKPLVDMYPKLGRKLRKRKMEWQRKLKRSQEFPQIGSRLFYVAKTEMTDRNENPSGNVMHTVNRRHDPGIPLTVQFAALDNDFDYESENKDKHINGIDDEKASGNSDDDLAVEDNLEDDGETISEDNVLENVIGKYIMRKRVQSARNSNKSEVVEISKKVQKRSVGAHQKPRKTVRKRLTSGHLTENNFKKFHKKNFTGKRHVAVGDGRVRHLVRRDKPRLRISRGQGNQIQTKRSALDLFKKITNKDKDVKKAEDLETRSAGFEPLLSLSDRKSDGPMKESEEPPSPQVRKLSSQDKVQPKLHRSDKVVERKKENSQVSAKPDGPWKLELNDKFEVKEERPGREWNVMEAEAEAGRSVEGSKDPKAYFVIRENVRRAKRKIVGDLPTTSGSSQTEVGTSYRPRSDAGRGLSKTHIRKRSLEPSVARTKSVHQHAGEASLKEPITENPLTNQEHNRALHDTESLSEGDSKPQAPHVLQRNSNKNGSFVTGDERNHRFLSRRKLMNLKSVFPPSSDANIIRDSRDINEGTSEYLSQQIVEAILSHVSTNPKFKELIAPGLTVRTPVHKENIEEKRRALQKTDFDEQLQSFLEKFMFGLEKLAAKHAARRMCNQIDKQSKDFLHSLLNVPEGRKSKQMYNIDTSCSDPEEVAQSSPVTTLRTPQSPSPLPQREEVQEEVLSDLKRKQSLLWKLIDEYRSLSKLEQESLDVNYRYLKQELEQTNRKLALSGQQPGLVRDSDLYAKISNDKTKTRNFFSSKKLNNKGFEPTKNVTDSEDEPLEGDSRGKKNNCQQPPSTMTPIENTSKSLPTFFFEPAEEQTSTPPSTTKTTVSSFEKVHPFNDSDKSVSSDSTVRNFVSTTPLPMYCFEPQEGNVDDSPDNEKQHPNEFEETIKKSLPSPKNFNKPTAPITKAHESVTVSTLPAPTPQSFDLLSSQNSTGTKNLSLPSNASESVRIKQSVPKDDSFESDSSPSWRFQNVLYPAIDSIYNPSALNRLNTGDAAGLQLSLKTRGPWVSTLDVAKSFRNIPNNFLLPHRKLAGNNHLDIDVPLAPADFKNTRSFIAPRIDFFNLSPSPSTWDKPAFPFRIDKKFYAYKQRPLGKVMGIKDRKKNKKNKKCQMLPFRYVLRRYPMTPPKAPPTTHGVDHFYFGGSIRKKKRRYPNRARRRFRLAGGAANSPENSELRSHLRSSVPAVCG